MAEVSKLDKLKAAAVGGPTAAAEYEQAQKAVVDIKQRALNDAANRSGFIDAPEAFRQQSAHRLSVPLDAEAQALGTEAGGARAYSSAMQGAQGNYLGAVKGAEGLYAQKARESAQSEYNQAYKSLLAERKRQSAEARQFENESKANAKDVEQAASKEAKVRKEFARQDAAADNGLNTNTYDTIADVLKNADDVGTALRFIEGYDFEDVDGDPVDQEAVIAYTLKALDPEAFAQQLIADPARFGRFAK